MAIFKKSTVMRNANTVKPGYKGPMSETNYKVEKHPSSNGLMLTTSNGMKHHIVIQNNVPHLVGQTLAVGNTPNITKVAPTHAANYTKRY